MSYLTKGLFFLSAAVLIGAAAVGHEGATYVAFNICAVASAFAGMMNLMDAFHYRYIQERLIEPPPKQIEAQKADSVYEFPLYRGKWSYYGGTDGKPPPPPPPRQSLPETPSAWLQRAISL